MLFKFIVLLAFLALGSAGAFVILYMATMLTKFIVSTIINHKPMEKKTYDLEYVKKGVQEGFILNPNEKVVNGIIKGLNRCEGECPCANTGKTLADRMCPCKNYREEGHCCCHLYLPINKEDAE